MIDRDLAELYGVETKVINQAVKRNIERFPEEFRFQLNNQEMNELVDFEKLFISSLRREKSIRRLFCRESRFLRSPGTR